MNHHSKKTIEAIVRVEIGTYEDEISSPWIISKFDSWFTDVRIYSGIIDAEIGLVMLAACLSSSVESSDEIIKGTASETLKIFIADEGFVLSGGLIFKENDEIKVSPGCCGGLEDWYNWFEVPKGKCQILTGHDPFSLVEVENKTVKIWHDRELKKESLPIEFSTEELSANLKNVEKDLKDFLVRLAQWTRNIEPSLEKQVVVHFAKNMHIEV